MSRRHYAILDSICAVTGLNPCISGRDASVIEGVGHVIRRALLARERISSIPYEASPSRSRRTEMGEIPHAVLSEHPRLRVMGNTRELPHSATPHWVPSAAGTAATFPCGPPRSSLKFHPCSVPSTREFRLRSADDRAEDVRALLAQPLFGTVDIVEVPCEPPSRRAAPFSGQLPPECREPPWTVSEASAMGVSGLRSSELGVNRGRSTPLLFMFRRSSRLIGTMTNPTVIGWVRPGKNVSNLTLTLGIPLVVSICSTAPGHQRPVPNRTTHTQTVAPGSSSSTSDGFMDTL